MILELLVKTPTVEKLFADSAYAGPKQAGRLRELGVPERLEIVNEPRGKEGLYRSISSLGSSKEPLPGWVAAVV